MATYRVELRELATNGWSQTTADLTLSGFACRWTLNGAGGFDGAVGLDVADADLANVGARELIVYRNDSPIWGGYLTNTDVDRQNRMVRVGAEGYWSRARKRLLRINKIATAMNPHTLAWDLLSHTQSQTNGDLKWTQGASNASTGTVTRELCKADLPNIGQVIEDMSGEGLFDFAMMMPASPSASNVAVFTTWALRGTSKVSTVQFTGSNTMAMRYGKSADGLITVVDGVGEGECAPPRVTVSANLATYGRLEATPVDVDSEESGEVTTAATELLTANKVPAWRADVAYYDGDGPSFTAYDIGDTVRLVPNDGLANSFDLRVVERELAVEPTQAGLISVYCEERAS